MTSHHESIVQHSSKKKVFLSSNQIYSRDVPILLAEFLKQDVKTKSKMLAMGEILEKSC